MKTYCKLACVSLALVATSIGTPCFAYLGGFEGDDGYEPFLNDVSTYNAGQYGPNAGGGVYAPTPDLWAKLQGPLYPTPGAAGGVAYATGHGGYDRTNPGSSSDQALVITTNADGWAAGSQEYSYTVDSYDLAGFNPNATGSETVCISFWSCSWIVGTDEIAGGGLPAGTVGNTISFLDTSDNLGFALGYRQPGTTDDFAAINVNGTWVQSAIEVDPHGYHRWDVILDLDADTVSIDIFESGTLTTLATGVPLINNMSDLDEIRFLSTPGVNNSKVWALDDFSMKVEAIPEPSSVVLMGAAFLAMTAFGYRRRKG